jgi:MraZ protein
VSEAFRGEFAQKVDGKARVSIPAAFRRVIEAQDPASDGRRARFVIVYGGDGRAFCECYTMQGMKRLEARIARMSVGDRRRIYLTRNMIRLSTEAEIDEDGRIVLPPKARAKIGLPDSGEAAEAMFAGDLDKFQIWSRTGYDADLAAQSAVAGAILADGEDMLALLPADGDEGG